MGTVAGLIALGGLLAMGAGSQTPIVRGAPDLPRVQDKTLVAWVRVANLEQRGGSVLTLESSESFDALVLGERRAGAWMAGSEMFHRTQADQTAVPVETARPQELIRLAAVYRGRNVTLYRNDVVLASYEAAGERMEFGAGACVLIGLRHRARARQPDSYFAGSVDEARLYAAALSGSEIAALRPGRTGDGPRPLGRWTFDAGDARDSEGNFPAGALVGGAVIRGGSLILDGKEAHMVTPAGRQWRSSFHYRPENGNVADPIPFFWKGEYHVFYLQGDVGLVPWQHLVSKNLVDWRELPTALVSDGAPDGPDGGHMFTGSVMEHAGVFHIFYTGHNPQNPAGLEVIRHATSPDLVYWTKDAGFNLGPDGVLYSARRNRNWRDPFVFWNAEARQFWMVVIASDAADASEPGRAVQGLLVSDDLRSWRAMPPISGGRGEECPDLFSIGATRYLIGAGRYVSGTDVGGPYVEPRHSVIDFPGIYAGKRMFDGKRHIWVGWAWDGPATTDAAVAGEGVLTWGGFLCLPRELYAGADRELLCRPAAEATALFGKSVYEGDGAGAIQLPGDCMVEVRVSVPSDGEASLLLRKQTDGRCYRLIVRPARGELALVTPASTWVRSGCQIDASRPITLRAFLDGSMLECFVNDAYAITRRVYDLDEGTMELNVGVGGKVERAAVRVPSRPVRIIRSIGRGAQR